MTDPWAAFPDIPTAVPKTAKADPWGDFPDYQPKNDDSPTPSRERYKVPILSGTAELVRNLGEKGTGLVTDAIGRSLAATNPELTMKNADFLKKIGQSEPMQALGATKDWIGENISQARKDHPVLSNAADVGEDVLTLAPFAKPAMAMAKGAAGGIDAAASVAKAPFKAIGSAITPEIDPAKLATAKMAREYGFNVGMDDLTNSRFYKTLMSEGEGIPFSGAASRNEANAIIGNKEIAKTFGADAEHITPEVLSKTYDDFGNQFSSYAKDKSFSLQNPEFIKNVAKIEEDAQGGIYGSDGEKFLSKQMEKLKKIQDGEGNIKGEALNKLRSELSRLARKTSSPDTADLLNDIEDSVIDIMIGGDPAARKSFTDLKYRYKNFKTILPLAIKNQSTGNIPLTQLTNVVKNKFGENSLGIGDAGSLGDLARIGQLLKEPANSMTAQRSAARGFLTGNLVGSVPNFIAAGPIGIVGQALSSGAALGVNRLLQNRNSNQALVDALIKGGK